MKAQTELAMQLCMLELLTPHERSRKKMSDIFCSFFSLLFLYYLR